MENPPLDMVHRVVSAVSAYESRASERHPFGRHDSFRGTSVRNARRVRSLREAIEFYRLKVPNAREFISGVSIEETSDLRDISIITDLRDQRCFIDWNRRGIVP